MLRGRLGWREGIGGKFLRYPNFGGLFPAKDREIPLMCPGLRKLCPFPTYHLLPGFFSRPPDHFTWPCPGGCFDLERAGVGVGGGSGQQWGRKRLPRPWSSMLKCSIKGRLSQESGNRMSSFQVREKAVHFCGGRALCFMCISNSFNTNNNLLNAGVIIPILWWTKRDSKMLSRSANVIHLTSDRARTRSQAGKLEWGGPA